MWYTTGALFLFSRHIIRLDVLAHAFSLFILPEKTPVTFESLNEVCQVFFASHFTITPMGFTSTLNPFPYRWNNKLKALDD